MEFKMPERAEISHKGDFGRVLNISGSDYMPGAACLSSLAALTVGCGYVFLCSGERVIQSVAAQTQNIVFAPIEDIDKQLELADVVLIGCGLSMSNLAKTLVKKTLDDIGEKPLIIDADGLNILSEFGDNVPRLSGSTILTPHPKEASRLLGGVAVDEILSDSAFFAKEISKKYWCVTVLKSHKTVVCSKDLEVYINNTGSSALAKAGSGDVLAGIITGLAAQKMSIFEAAKLGVYLHGLAGDLAKNDLTEYGVLAINQVKFIPNAIKTIL